MLLNTIHPEDSSIKICEGWVVRKKNIKVFDIHQYVFKVLYNYVILKPVGFHNITSDFVV